MDVVKILNRRSHENGLVKSRQEIGRIALKKSHKSPGSRGVEKLEENQTLKTFRPFFTQTMFW
jgi:hypothetical protein